MPLYLAKYSPISAPVSATLLLRPRGRGKPLLKCRKIADFLRQHCIYLWLSFSFSRLAEEKNNKKEGSHVPLTAELQKLAENQVRKTKNTHFRGR